MVSLVIADESGEIYNHPYLELAAKSGDQLIRPHQEQLLPLPFGSQLFTMPGRVPIGWDNQKKDFSACNQITIKGHKKKCFPVAAFPAPGYLRTLLPATKKNKSEVTLPLWSYTAVGWKNGRFGIAALQVDPNPHWHPKYFQNDQKVMEAVKTFLKEKPKNRLLQQLARCALEYHCFAAKNLFLQRWECPLPTSPVCNSRCLGCLSLQPGECCPSSQERIKFVPTIEELKEIALPHLEVEDSIVSFGQGCEGEPLLQKDTLAGAIGSLRKKSKKGVINLNTNGSLPLAAEELFSSGLDSIRVSLNSLSTSIYELYYRPQGYCMDDVMETIERAKKKRIFTAINLLVFPGITDREKEWEKLCQFIKETKIDLIQMRNLNIDPDFYFEKMEKGQNQGAFLPLWEIVKMLRGKFPEVKIGYFNQPSNVIKN